MSLLDRIRPGGGTANDRAKIIVMAAEAGMSDDAARQFADRFKTFDEAAAELDRRRAEADKGNAASPREIVAMCARFKLPSTLAEELIEAGVTMEAAATRMQAVWAAQGDGHEYGARAGLHRAGDPAAHRKTMTDKLTAWMLGEDPKSGKAMTVSQVAAELCQMHGVRDFDFRNADPAFMGLHSTSDFPTILDGAMGNLVARRIDQRQPDIVRLSHEVARVDFREGKLLSLSATGEPVPVSEHGEIPFVSVLERGEALPVPEVMASMFGASYQMLVNDSTAQGLFNDIAARMAEGAIERFGKTLHAPLEANAGAGDTLSDGNPVFHSTRGNLASSGGGINATSLSTAFVGMRTQRGQNGELLQIEPRYILVHPKREAEARMAVGAIVPATADDVNPFSGALDVVVDARLADPDAWFVVADPGRFDGLAHAFLQGQRRPQIESREGWDRLGTEWRLIWPMAARFVAATSWYMNPGK